MLVLEGCEVQATADGGGGFVVVVMQGDQRVLAVHVPPAAKRMDAQYWTATEWGAVLLAKLYAKIPAPRVAGVRKWKGGAK